MTMKRTKAAVALIGSLLGTYAGAQSLSGGLGLVVYPSSGQDSTQQARDEGECYQWAKNTTGVDPANPMAGVQVQTAAGAPPPGGQAAAGAMRGAAGAALIGNIADEDAGEFAAAGALIGGVRGARRAKEQQAHAQQQAAASNDAAIQQRMQLFGNAFGACMEGRKYTVK
jgi:hypothetical protein